MHYITISHSVKKSKISQVLFEIQILFVRIPHRILK